MDMEALKQISSILDQWNERHRKETPQGVAVGGGEWMDSFFKVEGLSGIVESLRDGADLDFALEWGKIRARKAVKIWNSRREYQVHRWVNTADAWLEGQVRIVRLKIKKEK